jgi:hypothetical protein
VYLTEYYARTQPKFHQGCRTFWLFGRDDMGFDLHKTVTFHGDSSQAAIKLGSAQTAVTCDVYLMNHTDTPWFTKRKVKKIFGKKQVEV